MAGFVSPGELGEPRVLALKPAWPGSGAGAPRAGLCWMSRWPLGGGGSPSRGSSLSEAGHGRGPGWVTSGGRELDGYHVGEAGHVGQGLAGVSRLPGSGTVKAGGLQRRGEDGARDVRAAPAICSPLPAAWPGLAFAPADLILPTLRVHPPLPFPWLTPSSGCSVALKSRVSHLPWPPFSWRLFPSLDWDALKQGGYPIALPSDGRRGAS